MILRLSCLAKRGYMDSLQLRNLLVTQKGLCRVKHTAIEGGKAILEVREDGVIHLIWQPKARVGVADVKAAMSTINDVCAGSPHPRLVEMAETETVSHDARAAFSTPCSASQIALLGASPIDQIIANFRPADTFPCPTCFFTDRSEALS